MNKACLSTNIFTSRKIQKNRKPDFLTVLKTSIPTSEKH